MNHHIDVKDLSADRRLPLSEQEMEHVCGGIALLLPAVQAAREAARRSEGGTYQFTSGKIAYTDYNF